MSSIETIQDNSIKIGGYFQITHPIDKSIGEIFEITLIKYDPSTNQNKIIGYSIDELDYSIEIIQERNYFYIEGFDQGYKVRFEENINDFYGQEILATNLPEFVQKHLDGEWNWFALSRNPGIPIEFIEETLGQEGYEWEWDYIEGNLNITPDFVQEHLYEIKNWSWLSKNSGIPIEFIEETLDQEGYEWKFGYIEMNPNITPEFVQKHRHEINDWYWNELSKNSGIPIEFIDETLYQEGYKWKWGQIEKNRSITPEFVKKHRHEIVYWKVLTFNRGIPIEFIEETLGQEGYKWKWRDITSNPNITPEFVQKHLDKIQNWYELSLNSGIPIEFIEETLGQEGYEWNWDSIFDNPNITPEFVREHFREIEDWDWLSDNPGIPIEFIEETLGQEGYEWDWSYITGNPNITPELVQKHLNENWDWNELSENSGIPIEFIDETWGQPEYHWDLGGISERKEPYNKQPMIKAARS